MPNLRLAVTTRKGRSFTRSLAAALAAIALLIGLMSTAFAVYTSSDTTADWVCGQPDFITSASGTSATSLRNPAGIAVDSSGGLYVADSSNNRVLFFPAGSVTATRVYGQGATGTGTEFTTSASGTSATSLSEPRALAVDANGNLYVTDRYNSRVLFFPAGSVTATRVYGQGTAGNDFAASAAPNPPSATSMFFPDGVAVDTQGGFYVADSANNRVLHFPAYDASKTTENFTADRVYGQSGSMITKNAPNPPTATSLNYPIEVTVDANGGLYVADYNNIRILYYPAGSTTADRVYGQPNMNTANPSLTINTLNGPNDVEVASDGSLYVADYNANRVLHYPANPSGNGPDADQVYGQDGNFTTNNSPNPPTATSLNAPWGLAISPLNDSLYVADYDNNRVLQYTFPTQVSVTTQPEGAKPGGLFTVEVQIKDANGDVITSYNDDVTVELKSPSKLKGMANAVPNPSGATLSGTLTVKAVNGVATFTDLSIDQPGTYVLTFNAVGIGSTFDSEPFTVLAETVAHSSDLVPQLRVSPDRVVSTNPENLVSFSFKVKNIGAGSAGDLVISLPVPQGLDVGYLAEGATSGVWVKHVTATTVTIGLPNLEKGKEASGVLVFRPNANAVVGTEVVETYTLTYNDEVKSGKSLNSNTQSFAFGEANSDESEGAIQHGAAVSAIAGEKVSITQTGYLANELVAQWYTAPDGTTVSLGMHRANADGVVTIAVNTAGLSGDYAIVGYGNRSEFTQVNILTVV